MRRNLRRGRSTSAGRRELVLDLLAPWTRGVEIRLGEAADLGLPAGAAINLIAQADQPARQLGSIEGRGVRPMRACTYFSISFRATRTLSRCAAATRASRPTKAVKETLFGAENVASQPARWSIVVTSAPRAFVYVRLVWDWTTISAVI